MDKHSLLKDGTPVVIREMTAADADASLAFFRAIPECDRAYLRRSIETRESVEQRIGEMVAGRVARLVAVAGDRIVADGALEFNTHKWKDHVGEIRLIVAHDCQGKGLGELMALELYAIANRRKLEEIIVEMMGSQTGVQRVFERLGFHKEAEFPEFVKDTTGKRQDLIVMRCPLAVLWDKLEEHMAAIDWHQDV